MACPTNLETAGVLVVTAAASDHRQMMVIPTSRLTIHVDLRAASVVIRIVKWDRTLGAVAHLAQAHLFNMAHLRVNAHPTLQRLHKADILKIRDSTMVLRKRTKPNENKLVAIVAVLTDPETRRPVAVDILPTPITRMETLEELLNKVDLVNIPSKPTNTDPQKVAV